MVDFWEVQIAVVFILLIIFGLIVGVLVVYWLSCLSAAEKAVNVPKNRIPKGGELHVGVLNDSERETFMGYEVSPTTTIGDYTTATACYSPGDAFPEVMQVGDVYICGDYEYRFNQVWVYGLGGVWLPVWLLFDEYEEGWGARVLDDTQEGYGEILPSINGVPVVNLYMTFRGCSNLKKSPSLPSEVANLSHAYNGCISMKTAPVIPEAVNNLNGTFVGCISLRKAPVIPESVEHMYETFRNCKSLTGTVVINGNLLISGRCFVGTEQPIYLSGACSEWQKEILAESANYNNIIY